MINRTRLIFYENQAIEPGMEEFEDEDQTEKNEESFQSACLGVEVALGSTNL